MLIHLHSQATTTPRIRVSDEPAWVLAERFGTTEQTVWKWRKRNGVQDRSHTAHQLQTTLTPAQKAVAVSLRKTLLVSLDDLLAVVREFINPDVSRLSYGFLRLPCEKVAAVRHLIYAGQRRRLDRSVLGLLGPFLSLISRRLFHEA